MDRRGRPDSVIRKHADGTYEVDVGRFSGRSEDRDHAEFSLSRATGMDRETAKKLVKEVDAMGARGDRAEIAFHNRNQK